MTIIAELDLKFAQKTLNKVDELLKSDETYKCEIAIALLQYRVETLIVALMRADEVIEGYFNRVVS